MRRILILVTGEPPSAIARSHGGFDAMILRAAGPAWGGSHAVADARGSLPSTGDAAAVVVTGSSSSVHHREPWMLATVAWLRQAVARGTPVLGICFGHQILAQALGGTVAPNPRGQERGPVPIEVTGDDPLLRGTPRAFLANTWHDDTVTVPPPGSACLARSTRDARQLLRFAPAAYGTQFHPEFDGAVMRSYVRDRADELTAGGHDVAALERKAADTPDSEGVLRSFLALAVP